MMRRVDGFISKNYKKISLDIKLESLACHRLAGTKSKIKKRIIEEAEKSISPDGDFLINIYNDYKKRSSKKLSGAEHWNVLYLMGLYPPRGKILPKKA
jgi:hypothetical protein